MTKLHIPKGGKQTWETPPHVFDALDQEFGPFDLDPACELDQYTALTILARGGSVYIPTTPVIEPHFKAGVLTRIHVDGLDGPWHAKRVWLQPPYADLDKWVPKAVHEVEIGNAGLICALIPSRTGPRWWQANICQAIGRHVHSESCDPNCEKRWVVSTDAPLKLVRFLPGRIQFVGANQSANFDMAVVVWSK